MVASCNTRAGPAEAGVEIRALAVTGYVTRIRSSSATPASLASPASPAEAAATVQEAFDPWKAINQARAKSFPLACHR